MLRLPSSATAPPISVSEAVHERSMRDGLPISLP